MHRFFAALPFSLLVEVVRAAGRVVADLTERRDVQRVVELTVPVRVEALPHIRSRRRFDRCGRVLDADRVRGAATELDQGSVVATDLVEELEGLADGLDTPSDRVVTPPTRGVHTAALLFALDSFRRDAHYRDARTVLLVVAGAGITVGSALRRR